MFEWLQKFTSTGMTAFITHPECYGHNMGEGHPESPVRLAAIRAALEKAHLLDRLQEIAADEVSDVQLARVHPPRYVQYLESVAPDVGTFRVDTDTAMNSGTLLAARYAAGAVVKAVDIVLKRKAPNAFCAVRPPGHHAESEKAMGFCFFNNIAVGAMHAIAEHHIKRILIVDFDVHHGNGTDEIFKDDPRVMLLSSFQHPFYPYCGDKPRGGNPNIINTPLPENTDGTTYRKMFEQQWLPAIAKFAPELIMVSAGFDAHKEDEMGGFLLNDEDFAWIGGHLLRQAQLYAQGRIISVLEGGYHPESLARCVAKHIKILTTATV